MISVWKFDVPVGDEVAVAMPRGAVVVHVGTQRDEPRLWALVDTEAPVEVRRFLVVGTGHPVRAEAADLRHVGTWTMFDDALVFHLFEVLR